MPLLADILIANFLISSVSLIGIFFLALKKERLQKILLVLLGLSAGTQMGGAFLHLLPEAGQKLSDTVLFPFILASFVIFYLIEKVFHWRHCHEGECKIHTFGYINLVGDSVHNFIDGLIIAATFLVDLKLGIVTSIAIVFHEIPQEIGDFGVLLYSGFEKRKALIFNFLTALTAIAGGIIGYFLSFTIQGLVTYLLPFAAGGFLYISTSDLIPEIRKETNLKKSLLSFGFFLIGILIMYFARLIE
ncbi:MAG: ZIP family metal transporter [Candidatus Pacebacteria bacterium]|nr:ZIP family metal transporter [Candidatus Paceibacterota bacterium]